MSGATAAAVHSWTDWRINLVEPRQSVVFPGPHPVTGELLAHAELLAQHTRALRERTSDAPAFLLEFDGFRYRVQRIRPDLYAARTLRNVPLKLTELGFKKDQESMLLSEELQRTGGLVIVFGATGAGKTTTVAGTIISRLEKMGGYCLCVEDPPENILEGFHGDGYIEQMDASQIGYEAALVDALRCFPAGRSSMMMLGEIRSRAEAYEAAQVALDGHLVFTTMHAKDIVSGLSRLVSLISATGEQGTRAMLAEGLVLAVHLRLNNKVPQMSVLKFNQMASAIVKNGELHSLQDEILLQNKLVR